MTTDAKNNGQKYASISLILVGIEQNIDDNEVVAENYVHSKF